MKARVWHVVEESDQQILKFYLHDIQLSFQQVLLVGLLTKGIGFGL